MDQKLIETYKQHRIRDNEGLIEVEFPDGRIFVVALDDSKSGGNRSIVRAANNVETAREYIDLVVG